MGKHIENMLALEITSINTGLVNVDQEPWRSFMVKKLEATVNIGTLTRIKRSMNKGKYPTLLCYRNRHIDDVDT